MRFPYFTLYINGAASLNRTESPRSSGVCTHQLYQGSIYSFNSCGADSVNCCLLYSCSLAEYSSFVKLCQPVHFPVGLLPHPQSLLILFSFCMAEGVGFEPTVPIKVRLVSSEVPSATRPTFLYCNSYLVLHPNICIVFAIVLYHLIEPLSITRSKTNTPM